MCKGTHTFIYICTGRYTHRDTCAHRKIYTHAHGHTERESQHSSYLLVWTGPVSLHFIVPKIAQDSLNCSRSRLELVSTWRPYLSSPPDQTQGLGGHRSVKSFIFLSAVDGLVSNRKTLWQSYKNKTVETRDIINNGYYGLKHDSGLPVMNQTCVTRSC